MLIELLAVLKTNYSRLQNQHPYPSVMLLGLIGALSFYAPHLFWLIPLVWGAVLQLLRKLDKSSFAFVFVLSFNFFSIWWIGKYSISGMLYTVLYGSFVQFLPFWLFIIFRKRKTYLKFAVFVATSLSAEYYLIHSPLPWPWLLLGNAFGDDVAFVQWYEFTGVLGGSLLLFMLSCFIAVCTVRYYTKLLLVLSVFALSFVLSKFCTVESNADRNVSVAIVQPNISPYSEKFTLGVKEQLKKLLHMSLPFNSTDYIFWPETALHGKLDEDSLVGGLLFPEIFADLIPARVISGAETYSELGHFNSAVLFDKKQIAVYHKNILVPVSENFPMSKQFESFYEIFFDVDGFYDTLQSEKYNWAKSEDFFQPIICFESAFGEYVAQCSKEKYAIAVLTNDGWWDGTIGNYQHLRLSRLRAVESRKSVVRCANTGYSAIIDANGEVFAKSESGVDAVLSGDVSLACRSSYYSKYGDYIGAYSCFVSILLILLLSLFSKSF